MTLEQYAYPRLLLFCSQVLLYNVTYLSLGSCSVVQCNWDDISKHVFAVLSIQGSDMVILPLLIFCIKWLLGFMGWVFNAHTCTCGSAQAGSQYPFP